MFRPLSLAAALTALATAATADAMVDRYLTAQQAFQDNMVAFYVGRAPQLEGKFPDFMADDEARAAMVCGFNHVRSETGDAGAEEFLTWLEEAAATPFESLGDLSDAPEGDVGDAMLGAIGVCNSMEVSQRLMKESGFMEIFSDPEVMQLLIAE